MKKQNSQQSLDVLVLVDFQEPSYIALKYILSVAKLIELNIQLFHVVEHEIIDSSHNLTNKFGVLKSKKKAIKDKLTGISEVIKAEGISVESCFSEGNLISEIEYQIKQSQPDLVVIGKHTNGRTKIGEVTDFLLNQFQGSLLIVGQETSFGEDTQISVGFNDKTLNGHDPALIFEFDKHTKKALTLLNVKKASENHKEISLPKQLIDYYEDHHDIKIEYENNNEVAVGLIKHIAKENIELLCLGKGQKRNFIQKLFSIKSQTVLKLISEINIPLLFMGTTVNKKNRNYENTRQRVTSYNDA